MISPEFYNKSTLKVDDKGKKSFPIKELAYSVVSYPYVLQEGDTLYSLAEKMFGNNTSLWTVLADTNKARRFQDWQPGDTIMLPVSVVENTVLRRSLKSQQPHSRYVKKWNPVEPIDFLDAPTIPPIVEEGVLTITKVAIDAAAPHYRGDVITYKLHIANSGGTTFSGAIVSDYLDSNTVYVGSTPSGVYDAIVNSVKWVITVPPHSFVDIYLMVSIGEVWASTFENELYDVKPVGLLPVEGDPTSIAIKSNPYTLGGTYTTITNTGIIGRKIIVSVDGLLITNLVDYTFNPATGVIDVTPLFGVGGTTAESCTVYAVVHNVIEKILSGSDTLTSWTNTSLIGKKVGFAIDGYIQNASQFTFDSALGKITPTNPMLVGQKLIAIILRSSIQGVTTNPIEYTITGTGDTTAYTNSVLINRHILVVLDGFIQIPSTGAAQFIYTRLTGTITPVAPYVAGQKLQVFIL
jgi:uncharacterized repeat protein (TIGR01451 family)